MYRRRSVAGASIVSFLFSTECRALKFGFRWKGLFRPSRIRRSFRMTYIHRPGRRQRNFSEHGPVPPSFSSFEPKLRKLEAVAFQPAPGRLRPEGSFLIAARANKIQVLCVRYL